MTDELKVHDIDFLDIGNQDGGGSGNGGGDDTIHLITKKELNYDDSDADDDDENSDTRSYTGGDDNDNDDDDNDNDDDNDGDDDEDDDEDDHDDDNDDDDDDGRGDIDDAAGIGAGSDGDEADQSAGDKDELSDDDTTDTFKKFNQQLKMSYVADTHPEAESHNDDEVHAFAKVVRDSHGVIIDPLHKTIPILTKYEKTRILGMRTKQLNDGAEPYIKLPVTPVPIIDGYVIAQRELEEKKLPFIIRRPLPNGGTEYWYLQDLEIL
jgi:DNA-directed RNA polymerase subunit K/omega